MSEPSLKEDWTIVGSSSDEFLFGSSVTLPRRQGSARRDFLLNSEKLFDAEFPELPAPGGTSTFESDPFDKSGKRFRLKGRVFRGDTRPFLCGLVEELRVGGDPGGTEVWIAEERPPIDLSKLT